MSIPQSEWKWFGNAGHFIAARDCLFHMTTEVGDYMVSTVGEYRPSYSTNKDVPLGLTGLYETMVFKLTDEQCKKDDCDCGMRIVESWSELFCRRYEKRGEALAGHMSACNEYAQAVEVSNV